MVVMILIIVLLSKFSLHFFHNKSKEWIWNCKFLSRKLMYIAWCNICWYLSYHTNPSVIQWARSNCFYAQQFLIFINAFNSFSIWITPKIRENGCHLIHGFHDHSIYQLSKNIIVKLGSLVLQTEWWNISERNSILKDDLKKGPELTL